MKTCRITISLVVVEGMLLSLLLIAGLHASAQGSGWSEPMNISNSQGSSWFPAVAADGAGRVHVAWSENFANRRGLANDRVWYTVWDGESWSEPNDVFASSGDVLDAYTQRPSLSVDRSDRLHLLYRYPTVFYHMMAPSDAAVSVQAWTHARRVSGDQSSWADMAVDSKGIVHAVWSENIVHMLPGGVSVLSPGTNLFGKADDTWTTHTSSDGLSDDNILDVAIDAAGVKWFATDKGLSVLSADGGRWLTYSVADGLVHEQIHKVLIDELDRKWLATQNGVSVLDDAATPFDKSDDIWVTYTAADGLASDNVLDMATTIPGQVWFATDQGVSVLSVTDEKWMTFTTSDGLVSDLVQAILIDEAGFKWFGTSKGVSVLNDRGTPLDGVDDIWMAYVSQDGSVSNNVTVIASDARGRKWFGTASGLVLLDSNGIPTAYTTGGGLPDYPVTDITIDAAGNIWVGTAYGVGALSPDNGRQVLYTVDDGIAQSMITDVALDQNGDVWLGTWGGEQEYYTSDLFYRHSLEGEQKWSSPKNLSWSRGAIGHSLHIYIDARDVIHVVWDEEQSCGYRSSSDGGKTWSQRTMFFYEGGSPRQIVVAVDGNANILTIWRTVSPHTGKDEDLPVYYQTSSDGGSYWSEPMPIRNLFSRALNDTPYDGYNVATDSAGHVHLVAVGRTAVTDAALSVLHVKWDGNTWSAPTKIFSTTDFPERPAIAVSGGNQLHVVWFVRGAEDRFDEGGNYEVWYAQAQSAAPSVPPPPSPTPLPTPTLTPTPVLTPSPTPYPTLEPGTGGLPSGLYTDSDDAFRIAVALFPLILLVLLVMGVKLGWLSRLFRRRSGS
jgi:hypothetical protein